MSKLAAYVLFIKNDLINLAEMNLFHHRVFGYLSQHTFISSTHHQHLMYRIIVT